VAKTWIYAHQTDAERLEELYSKPDFDPKTRHYSFKDGKMVGFLTSKIIDPKDDGKKRANLAFPSVLRGHEESVGLLYEKAVNVLREKGVEIVETLASPLCGEQIELVQQFGFTHKEDLNNIVFIQKVKKLENGIKVTDVRNFDSRKDMDKWLAIVKKLDNRTDEQIEKIKDEIDDANVIAHLVIEDKDEIVGTVLVFRNPIKTESANLAVLYATEEKYFKQLIAKASTIALENGVEEFLIWLFGERLDLKDYVKDASFKFGKPAFSRYELEL
ncbi:MAG: hypothetical protein KAJ30_08885, partial [Candidatus Heimdallarchaeota archaeon]|nr:hypothetical protein [Candidatus Heimdallarchaeota archaeon]